MAAARRLEQDQIALIEHPIALWFIEISNISKVFEVLLKKYRTSNEPLNLDPTDDADAELINLLELASRRIYRKSASTTDEDPEKLRLNMYDNLFGLKITERGDFPVSDNRNEKFYPTLNNIMVAIFQGIQDQGTDSVRMADPARLADYLNDLRSQLINSNANGISTLVRESTGDFQLLIMLLNNDHLMQRLNIRARDWNERLIRIGNNPRINMPVSTVFQSHFQLANDMATFLTVVVQTPEWNEQNAAQLYIDQADIFRRINTAWNKIDSATDFADLAHKTRS